MQPAPALLLLPEPPANLSNDDAVETALSEVGKVQAKNLIQYNVNKTQMDSLQDWIKKQKAAWEKAK